MRINFRTITVENFLSYKEPTVLSFGGNSTLVTGDNGQGKSALFEGIIWGLFGKTSRNTKVNEVVNREAGIDAR